MAEGINRMNRITNLSDACAKSAKVHGWSDEAGWKRYVASACMADRDKRGKKIIVHSLICVEARDDAGAIKAAVDDAKAHYPKALPVSVKAVCVDAINPADS
jgi:hypothetical protein